RSQRARGRRRGALRRAQRGRRGAAMECLLDGLYAGDSGYASVDGADQAEQSMLTYGEFRPSALARLLAGPGLLDVAASPEDAFADLGSGTGKLPLAAFLLGVRLSLGVELAQHRHDLGAAAIRALTPLLPGSEVPPADGGAPAGLSWGGRRVELRAGSLLELPLSELTVVYAASLCFPAELMQALADRLREELRPGTVFWTLKELPPGRHRGIALVRALPGAASWDPHARVLVYMRVPEASSPLPAMPLGGDKAALGNWAVALIRAIRIEYRTIFGPLAAARYAGDTRPTSMGSADFEAAAAALGVEAEVAARRCGCRHANSSEGPWFSEASLLEMLGHGAFAPAAEEESAPMCLSISGSCTLADAFVGRAYLELRARALCGGPSPPRSCGAPPAKDVESSLSGALDEVVGDGAAAAGRLGRAEGPAFAEELLEARRASRGQSLGGVAAAAAALEMAVANESPDLLPTARALNQRAAADTGGAHALRRASSSHFSVVGPGARGSGAEGQRRRIIENAVTSASGKWPAPAARGPDAMRGCDARQRAERHHAEEELANLDPDGSGNAPRCQRDSAPPQMSAPHRRLRFPTDRPAYIAAARCSAGGAVQRGSGEQSRWASRIFSADRVKLCPTKWMACQVSSDIVSLLGRQLERCGPEQLNCPACPSCPLLQCPEPSFALGTFIAGLLAGVLSAATVGSRALAYYDPRDDYWHERIMLAHIQDFRFVVLTAHWDIYDEDMSQALRLLPLGPRGGLPVPRPQGQILRVDNARLSAELQQLCDEAAQMALDIREEEGLPAPAAHQGVLADGEAEALAEAPAPAALAAAARPAEPAAGGAAAAGALAAAPAAPLRAPAAGALLAPAPPRPAAPPADAVWLSAETRGGFTAGAPIPPELLGADGQPQVVLGDRGVVVLASGVSLAVAVANILEAGAAALSSSGGDLRTLPVLYSPAGGRSRSFHDAVAKMSTTPFPDWRIKGPRTAAWLLEKISEAGYTPLQRHFWWRSIQGLTASDSGVDDHHFISEVLQELTTYDQLNAGELVVVEILCRRYQLWEELYASSLREAEAGQDAAPWLDERSIFLGQDRSRGSALVCPALESWVAEKLREESAILKERRLRHAAAAAAVAPEAPPRAGGAPGLGASLQGGRGVLNDDATSLGFGDDSLTQRDALPIPLSSEALQCLKGFSALDGELSLGQRRKAARCRRQERWMLEGVAALNELGGGGRLAGSGGRLSLAQRSALQHLGEVYAAVPPKTEDCTNQEAFQALLGLRPGYADEPAIGARAGYQRGRVSLPSGGAGRVDLVRLLPPHLQSALESGHGLLRSEQEATAALEEADVTCYVDGKLAQRGIDYGRFLLELYDAGIVKVLDYELDRKEETGVFFVPRKDDKLRLIFDTRIAFRVRVVPMGWNWAVHFVQSAHLNVLASVSPNNQWLVDKQPGTCLSDSSAAAKVLYIDNFAAISTSRETALQVVNDMLGSFTSEGVRASLDLDVALLGFTLDSRAARWRPAPKKFWRVHGCISHMLEPGRRITGRQLERLMGHVVALLLLRREALSLLSAVYVFIRSTYDRAQPLWPSCRRELRWVLALLPTVFADMKRPWHSEVGAFDASPWGAGVCTARWPLSAVQAAGRQPEKLRFRGPLASLVAPRDAALAADSIELSDPAALLLGRAAGFAEVSAELLREERARLLPRQGFLAANKVRPSTQVLYLKVLRLLAGWLMVDALPDWPVAAWDAALADFLLWAFDQGVARATAARLGAAVLWGLPQLHVAPLQRCFPQLAHSLAGWKRLHPPGSRPPLPELVVRAAAAWLGHQGEFATALCVMLMFEGYLRPSEALALRAAQITGPFGSATSAGSHMSVVVHAAELQQPGKTGEMDHTVVLDLPRQQVLARALARLRDSRLGSWHPLWDFDYNLLQRRFGQALEAVGASCLAGTLYSLRHGGASHDRLTASRALMEVQQRGNWRAFNSARRYDKHGRVSIEWMKIPAHQRQEIEHLAAGLDAAFKLYSCPSAPIPVPASSGPGAGTPAALGRLPSDVDTVIFVDVDGVLNVGAKDNGGTPILLNDSNIRLARTMWTKRENHPERQTVETLMAVCQKMLDGESETLAKLATQGSSHVSDVLVGRLAEIVSMAGPRAITVLSSTWQAARYKRRLEDLERSLTEWLGRAFSFDATTGSLEETPSGRLRAMGNCVAELTSRGGAAAAAAEAGRLRVLLLEDFFISALRGAWSLDGQAMDSPAAVEEYIGSRVLPPATARVMLIHTYSEWVIYDGSLLRCGVGLTRADVERCKELFGDAADNTHDASSLEPRQAFFGLCPSQLHSLPTWSWCAQGANSVASTTSSVSSASMGARR
ncbi:unnamed protein product, partial [Prorocentrum cordatum]